MIIKTLILSQVIHLFNMTYTPVNFLEQIDKIIFSFLWSDRTPQVKRETIISKIEDGGLRMPDIFSFHIAPKNNYVKNILIEDGKCLNLYLSLGGIKKQLLDHKLTEKGLNKIVNINFHYQSLKCWFNFESKYPENIQDILNEYIFFNRYITIDDNMIQPRDLALNESSLKFRMIDLLSQNNKVMTCEELHSQPCWNTHILHINSLLF